MKNPAAPAVPRDAEEDWWKGVAAVNHDALNVESSQGNGPKLSRRFLGQGKFCALLRGCAPNLYH
jgi:hypothetical protein